MIATGTDIQKQTAKTETEVKLRMTLNIAPPRGMAAPPTTWVTGSCGEEIMAILKKFC